jgi:hypothetical protein
MFSAIDAPTRLMPSCVSGYPGRRSRDRELMQAFVVKERKNRDAAGTDRVPEASAMVTYSITAL